MTPARSRRRVVITGAGAVSPLGLGTAENWNALLSGTANLEIERFLYDRASTRFCVGRVPDRLEGLYERLLTRKERHRLDRFILLGIVAAEEAIGQAGIDRLSEAARRDIGVIIGSGIGGLNTIVEAAKHMEQEKTVFYLPGVLTNSCSASVSARHGFRGGAYSASGACATGTLTIGQAFRAIRDGYNDIMVAGGTEAPVNAAGIKVFDNLRALGHDESLSARQISRPWDVGRTGFVLSEGAAVVVLEEHDHAHRRNAPILGEVVGFGQSADAGDLVAPEPSGAGPVAAMRAALRDAGWQPNDIDWINAHATGTPHGDDVELDAIEQVFGDRDAERPLFVSSSKGLTGHLLGASGALQAVLGLEALRHDIVPPNTNLVTPSRLSRFHLPVEPVTRPLSTFMLNSFGFGGVNGCLAIGKEV